jgi:hypothetical protein
MHTKLVNNKIKYDTIASSSLCSILIASRFIQHRRFYDKEAVNHLINYKEEVGDSTKAKNVLLIEDIVCDENESSFIDTLYKFNVESVLSIINSGSDYKDWMKNKFTYLYLYHQEQF